MIEAVLANEVARAGKVEAEAYLRGAAHDSTFSKLHATTRFCQADPRWFIILGQLLTELGRRSWTYKEGRDRSLWVLETSWRPTGRYERNPASEAAYVRGYFDSEGGIPRVAAARFYVQFVQKDRADLDATRQKLLRMGIACGSLHNPSVRVDPDYWRFYVAAKSHVDFIERVGSWHPRKRPRLEIERARRLRATPLDAVG